MNKYRSSDLQKYIYELKECTEQVTRYNVVSYLIGYFGVLTEEMYNDINEAYMEGDIEL